MDKILLVDYKAKEWEDELRRALSPQDYELVCEQEGIKAIDRIRAEQPSLVLLSQRFPRQREKDGILILRGVKRTEIGAGLKTIMLLDKQSHRLEQECRLAGANYCFVRGNSLDEIKTQIEYALAVPKARILFIDDEWEKMNWDIRLSDNLGTGKLGPGGFEVLCVENETKAYKKLDEEKIDLVILDLKFPEGETYGIEILKEIKSRKPGLEVIMLSGLEVKPDIVLKCAEAGAPHYIEKRDIDWNKFADLINLALAESEHAREFHARIDRLEDEPQVLLPRKLRRQEIDELRRAVNSIASKDYSRPIHYFEAAMELLLKAQYDGNEQKQLPGLKEVVKEYFADLFRSFPILIPVEPNLIYLDKLRELRNCASHPPFPVFTIDDAIIPARISLRTVEGLLDSTNHAKIDFDLEELSARLESFPDGTLKQRLQLALIFIDRSRTECYQQIHEAVNEIILALYPQIIENPVWDDSAARIKTIAGEIKKVIIPWSQEENSLYLSADWEEFVDAQHLIRCYLDWTSDLYPHLAHLQQEDLIVCLRVAIRLAEWFLEDYQKSDLFKKVREGRKSKFYVTRRFPSVS